VLNPADRNDYRHTQQWYEYGDGVERKASEQLPGKCGVGRDTTVQQQCT
jgi:hypothetical protein